MMSSAKHGHENAGNQLLTIFVVWKQIEFLRKMYFIHVSAKFDIK